MNRRIAAPLLVAGLALVSPGGATAGPTVAAPEAAAWLVHVETPTGLTVRLGEAVARSGDNARAEATPAAVGDAAPIRAVADPSRPDEKVVSTPLNWTDPSGSMTLAAAFAEAQAAPASATSRAGFGTASGTGYPVASLFSWEQQERFLAQLQALNQAVFGPLNARMAALAPALAAAGVAAPHFEPMGPLALVDAGGQRMAAASAEVAASEGFASARAEATLEGVRILGGFVEARAVSAEAVSESAGGGEDRRARAWVGSLTVAGVPVVAEGSGIRVAGNDLFSRGVVQPALDLLLDSLRNQGVELRAAEARGDGPGREVAGLEVRMATPQGRWTVSVAGARATAPAQALPPAPPTLAALPAHAPAADKLPAVVDSAPPPAAVPASVPSLSWGADEPEGPEAVSDEAAFAQPMSPGTAGRPVLGARLPRAVARSLRAVFLLLAVAGAAGALVLPALMSPVARPTRRRTST
jgi:hypothetical protein